MPRTSTSSDRSEAPGGGSGPPAGTRSGSARALAAAVVVLAALSVVVSVPGHRRPLGAEAARAEPPPSAPAKLLYRLVGCESSGSIAHREGPHRKQVAIGFDDGPWSDTAAFVTMLERSEAPATFFMIGRQVTSAFGPLLLRELRDGDVLGDHTFSHPDLTRIGAPAVRRQLQQAIDAIRSASGYTPCLFRPPYGAFDASVLRIARSVGLSTILWDVDPADWAEPGTAAIEARVLAQVKDGSIIISHDGGGPRGETLAAYPGIIRKLRARGYRIVTLLQMLGYRPVYEPCIKLCGGIGVPRRRVPRGAMIVRAP